MEIFCFKPMSEKALLKKISDQIGEKILKYERTPSKIERVPYEIKSELDEKYLKQIKEIINEVGDFIRNFLPSRERKDFDFVRYHNIEFLSRSELLSKIKIKTEKEEKKLPLSFDLLGSVFSPKISYRIKGQDVYLYNHLESKISFVIGNRENPKIDEEIISGAMEELWHLAIYPHLIEKLNRTIKPSGFDPNRILVKEGELLSKAFALVSSEEFAKKRQYHFPNQEVQEEVKIRAEKVKSTGIKKALKEIS